jgi:spore maturation protein CgeB
MKILVVGDGHSAIHERAVADALIKLEHQVEVFYWLSYFNSTNILLNVWRRLQNKFLFGPDFLKCNKDFFFKAIQFLPDIIFVYRGTHLTVHSILALRRALPNCRIVGYNNDDPFSTGHPLWLWRHFKKCVPYYDLVLAYRHRNLVDFKSIGAGRVELLRSWFIPELNRPVQLSDEEILKYDCDIVFIGHYEDDGRIEYLETIVEAGYKLKIFGPPYEWNKLIEKSPILRFLSPVNLVWGADYNKAITGAKIALCFFSKLNRDTYTRRCFEIPAAKVMLLSEYSDDLGTLFDAGEEADFFISKLDMISKITHYLSDDELRQRVADAGYKRVIKDGHDVVSRMSKVLEYVKELH